MAPYEAYSRTQLRHDLRISAEEKRFELLVDLHPRRFSKPLP